MFTSILSYGLLAGVAHFILIGALYGNPVVDRIYAAAAATSPAVRRWHSKPRYLATQFLGTQVEVFAITAAFWWLRPAVSTAGMSGALMLGLVIAALRVYPRFWNMWIQTTYPRRLLAIEIVNGTIGTLAIALLLQALR
jgi:hypothetical protein